MNLNSLMQNINIKRIDDVLTTVPRNTLSTKFVRIKVFNLYRVFYRRSFAELET